MNNILNVGEILYVKDGKKGNGVSHDKGKIVLFRNKVKKGYAKITKVLKEADNYYLAEGENIPYDYYKGMSYAEFKEMLVARGYKIGYEQSFLNGWYPTEEQRQLFAYNMLNGIIVVADTFRKGRGYDEFNSIEVYVPHLHLRDADTLFHYCDYDLSSIDIHNRDIRLDTIEKMQRMQGSNNQWLYYALPYMWNYSEISGIKNPHRALKLNEGRTITHIALQTAMKFNLVNKEIRELFKDNKAAQDIFAMIDAMNEKGVDCCEVEATDDKGSETIYLYYND